MIIIKLPIKIKYISQIQYNKIISSLNFNNLQCPNCHSNGLIIHAYYERHVDIFDRNHTIRILRLKCPSCNSTHAVLIEDMVPYSVVSFNIIVDILKNNALFKKIVALGYLIQQKYRNDIRNMLP